jgi:hypothetical protein
LAPARSKSSDCHPLNPTVACKAFDTNSTNLVGNAQIADGTLSVRVEEILSDKELRGR